jgi:anti-sigma B factor antagonist
MHNGRCPVEVVSGVPVVAAPEEIDMISAPELRSALLEAAARGHGMLVVDMTRTQFCDSSGVHTLLAAHERAQAEGGELLLVVSATIVLRIFEVTGLDRIIRHFPSLDGALAQTSADADGSSGHRRADGAPGDSEHNRLVAQLSTSGRDGEPVDRIAGTSVARRVTAGPPKAEPG